MAGGEPSGLGGWNNLEEAVRMGRREQEAAAEMKARLAEGWHIGWHTAMGQTPPQSQPLSELSPCHGPVYVRTLPSGPFSFVTLAALQGKGLEQDPKENLLCKYLFF